MENTTKHTANLNRLEPKPYMTIRNYASISGISSFTLRKWHKEGRLPGIHAGNRFLIDVGALQAAIREGTM